MVGACADVEKRREREMWRRFAFLAAEIINVSGKIAKRTVKPEHLINFGDDRKRFSAEEREQRKREAAETLRLHKKKFWRLYKNESVTKITGE